MSHPRHLNPSTRSAGFTLVELLVVIGIIVLLISILLPVAGRVRLQAQSAKSQATMSAISGAIERYYLDHKAYPGTIPNTVITSGFTAPGGTLTSSENLVLSLVGGLQYGTPPTVAIAEVGKGPLNLSASAVRRTRSAPYIEAAAGGLLPPEPWDKPINGTTIDDNPLQMLGVPPATPDSNVPEFLDDYSQRRVVLYLRANVGGTTINATPTGTEAYDTDAEQYNQNHLLRYQRGASSDASNFGGDFQFSTSDTGKYPNWGMYLSHPNVSNAPRGKDKYILISAGADRAYGTRDDIFVGG